jgi:DtxR family Mn-dependent transcriptional regulator
MIEYSRGRPRLTRSQEDYLKALYELHQPGGRVSTAGLAASLGISAASVSEMVSRLSSQGLVAHDRFRGQRLTPEGEEIALELIRHHRLVEMFLVEVLGYRWDEVDEEAERLEHVISERMEERIFELLGRPELDPHGDPIPSVDGTLRAASTRSLLDCPAGTTAVIGRVSDVDPEKLRALDQMGLALGASLEVLATSRFESPISVRAGDLILSVPIGLAREIFVDEVPPDGG